MNTCPICGDLRCGCPEHFDPRHEQSMVRRFGLCHACYNDLRRLVNEVPDNSEAETVYKIARRGNQDDLNRIYDTLLKWEAERAQ